MIGSTLGSYRIGSEIGSGGMGVVYLAEHTLLGRKVAVKVLRSDMPDEYVERFFTEAKAAASLHHPGLVDVFDFGHHTDGSAFIVMEYLQGEALSARLEREPRLPVPIACAITRQVANALQVVHDEGIIHRDLKPANIFLVPDDEAPAGIRAKVLDFGIAKLIRDREHRSVKTASGAVIGTPRYMSPEQCKNASTVDGRSDIYSLGCILYEMLLGVAPFDYDSWAELVGAHIYEEPPRPTEIDPKLPPDVETLVCKMLEKSPDARFQSMQELAQSLEVLIRTHGGERIRLSAPPGRIVTPAQGVRTFDSGRDETLPAAALTPTPTGEKLPVAAKPADPAPTSAPPPPLSEAKPAKRFPWLALGLASVAVSVIALPAVLLGGKDTPAAQEPAYIVVDQRGSAAKPIDEPPREPMDEPASPPDAAVGDATVDAAIKTSKPTPTTTDTAALSRTFASRSTAITACFNRHPGTPADSVSVRIQIDTSGSVVAATVLPDAVAGTELGACITQVAKATRFGKQPSPATFRIPLVTIAR